MQKVWPPQTSYEGHSSLMVLAPGVGVGDLS
jgi:hypothetical protein